MANRDDELVPIKEVMTFYRAAYVSFLEADRAAAERDRCERAVAQEDTDSLDEDLKHIALLDEHEERFAMATIVFSAMALEALINDYGIQNSGRRYFKKHLDRLPALTKWLIFPRLGRGSKSMRTGGQTFRGLTTLFALRNGLMHLKASSKRKHLVSKKQAADAIKTVRKAVAELKRLDGRVSTRWLKTAEDACEA